MQRASKMAPVVIDVTEDDDDTLVMPSITRASNHRKPRRPIKATPPLIQPSPVRHQDDESIVIHIPGLLTASRAILVWVILEGVRFGYSIGWDIFLGAGR